MRKVEQKMIAALRDRLNIKPGVEKSVGGNTTVTRNGFVRLHGNLIASYVDNGDECMVTFAGWKTPTTASRLRAIIAEFGYKPVDGFEASTRNNGVDPGATYLMKRS
jgi:hypothetical protein